MNQRRSYLRPSPWRYSMLRYAGGYPCTVFRILSRYENIYSNIFFTLKKIKDTTALVACVYLVALASGEECDGNAFRSVSLSVSVYKSKTFASIDLNCLHKKYYIRASILL